ncbi:MAG TPA: nitroreductase [Clostridiaceae bacterium]|nr:nitroreductase [Clostridiaceae bacterium]
MSQIINCHSSNKNKFSIALDYHENTKHEQNRLDYSYNENISYKTYPNAEKIMIKTEKYIIENDFTSCLLSRKSVRDFTGEEISIENLLDILYLSYGINKDNNMFFESRMVPSAGARYPLEIYIAVFKCDKLESGIYHYNIISNCLEFIRKGDYRNKLYEYCNKQDFISNCSAAIIITSVFERTMEKYGERGYRYILLDAGHLGQNIYLTASHLKLGTVAIGGFQDKKINEILGIDGLIETSLYIIALGQPQVLSYV